MASSDQQQSILLFESFRKDLELLFKERNLEISKSPKRITGEQQAPNLDKLLGKTIKIMRDNFSNIDQILKIKEESERQIDTIRDAHNREVEELSAQMMDLKHDYERDILDYKEKMSYQVNSI